MPLIFPCLHKSDHGTRYHECGYSRYLEEACDHIQNIGVGHPIKIIKARSVDERTPAAIGCGPGMDTDPRRLGRDPVSDFDPLVTGDELDELFVA